MTNVAPFPFGKLKKISSSQAELLSRLTVYFPGQGEEPPYLIRLEASLKKYFGSSFRLKFESMFEAEYEKFLAGLPERFVCCAVSLTPLPKKVMIEFDPDLSFAIVDHLLGGAGEVPARLRSITPLEEGVLQFIIVKILKELTLLMPKAPFQYRLDKIITIEENMARQLPATEPVVLVTFRVRLGKADGYLRLCLAQPLFLQEALGGGPAAAEEEELLGGRRRRKTRFEDFNHFRTVIWGEVGRVVLRMGEVNQLRRGDIVLFDDAYPDYDGKKLSGRLVLHVGEQTGGGIESNIVETSQGLKVELERVFKES